MVKVVSGSFNFISLTHLNLYEERGNQRAPSSPKIEHTERVEVIPYGDGWPGADEPVFDF
jgi:hypothetical protein